MVSIFLDSGHGGKDPGAVGNGLQEKDLTLKITLGVGKILQDHGVQVYYTRTTDKYLELAERAQLANKAKCDYFCSIHINAGGGTGFESFIYNGTTSSKTVQFQTDFHSENMNHMKVADRGKKRANFAVLRLTNMPAILLENLFIDTKKDADYLKANIETIVKANAYGLLKGMGITPKPTTPKPSTPEPQPTTNIYRVLVDGKQIMALSDKKNIINQLDQHIGKANEITLKKI